MQRATNSATLRLAFFLCLVNCLSNLAGAQPTHYVDSLSHAASRTVTDSERANLFIHLSNAFKQESVTKEFYYANKALILANNAGFENRQAYAEQLLGDCYIKVLAYNDAIVHLQRSITASQKSGTQDVEHICLQLIVHCYHQLNRLQEAADYQERLLDLTIRSGDTQGICNQMSAYAERLSDMGRHRDAIGYLHKDIDIAKAHFRGMQQAEVVADMLNTLATIYIKASIIDTALNCLSSAEVLAHQAGNPFISAYILSTYCDAYIAAKQPRLAIKYGEEVVREGKVIKDLSLQQLYSKTLSQLYQEDHQPVKALQYHLSADSLTNIIDHTQKTIDQAMQLTRIDLEQQDERIMLEKNSLDAERQTQRISLIAAAIAVLALTIVTLLIYRNLRQKQRSNLTISGQAASLLAQNELIDAALKAKEVMLKETHHRIKNNLQLISSLLELQVADVGDEHAKNALRGAQRRIQSIAAINSVLSGSGEDVVEMSAFAGDLFTQLNNAFGSKGKAVRFVNEIPVTFLPPNTIILLGLILNELFTNSFKYAFNDVDKPTIHLSFKASGNEYILLYRDNGPGLLNNQFDAHSGSLGFYLVRRISKQLKGKAVYTFDAGSIFRINFKHAGD